MQTSEAGGGGLCLAPEPGAWRAVQAGSSLVVLGGLTPVEEKQTQMTTVPQHADRFQMD